MRTFARENSRWKKLSGKTRKVDRFITHDHLTSPWFNRGESHSNAVQGRNE